MAATTRKTKSTEPPDRAMRIRVGDPDDVYEIDLDDLSHDEAAEIERFMNKPLGEVLNGPWVESIQFATILGFLAKRRSEPNTTLASVRALTLGTIDLEEDATRPTTTRAENGGRATGKSPASGRGKSASSRQAS